MSQVIDNLIAYRVLSMLVKPFDQTDAYKLGIIDANGEVLIKSSELKTSQQKAAYNHLTRLVFNLKRMLNKLPGGKSKLKNMVAAFSLIKEAYERKMPVNEDRLYEVLAILDKGVILAEEQLIVEDFMLIEDAIANVTGAGVSTDAPAIKKSRRFAKFTVPDHVYDKFTNGKTKFRKWNEYLNLENEGESMIYNYARKNPKGVIILQNGKDSKAIRFNRSGGGRWSSIKRKPKNVITEE